MRIIHVRFYGDLLTLHIVSIIFEGDRLDLGAFCKGGLDAALEITPAAVGQTVHFIDIALHVNAQHGIAPDPFQVGGADRLPPGPREEFQIRILGAVIVELENIQINRIIKTFFKTAGFVKSVI